MKLRYLATVVALALTTVAAHAQSQEAPTQGNVGLYMNPLAFRVSNSVVDSGPYAFFGQNSTSRMVYGFDMGGYYDFAHSGPITTGFDVRFSDLHGGNAMLRNFLVGLRISGRPSQRRVKPYFLASIGTGTTKAPASTVEVKKVDYMLYGGVDYSFAHHVDFRIAEIGWGSLTTVSSATVGAGGDIAIPSSTQLSVSSGLVFRF
jgi:hypothetical protein